MVVHDPISSQSQMDRLSKAVAALGFEIVDIAGFLDLVIGYAKAQRLSLDRLGASADDVRGANVDANDLIATMSDSCDPVVTDMESSVALVRAMGAATRGVAEWVQTLKDRTDLIAGTLQAVKVNNGQIAKNAFQVNALTMNSKIDAVCAGDTGRGFAVVADAINNLSRQARQAADQISGNMASLTDWFSALGHEFEEVADEADKVLSQATRTDAALSTMQSSIEAEHEQVRRIATQTDKVASAMIAFKPALEQISSTVTDTGGGIEKTHARMRKMVDLSESIVQDVAGLGGKTVDAPFIAYVQQVAADISDRFDAALRSGEISMAAFFDQNYQPVAKSDPQQFLSQGTAFLDRALPDFQEPALAFHDNVVFCAAVDTNGYLPTHNSKFSRAQRDGPVWNAAHCRNRRIFDDRVGLKAGRNTAPFLLQVYRRDMGGG